MKSKKQPELYIRMLGAFTLNAGDVSIDDSANRSRKMWNLLAYLIVKRGKAVSQQELIDALWPDEESQNPLNALKTLLYRIRMLLSPLQDALGEELILSQRGAYSWNASVPCKVDMEDFETFCRHAETDGLDPAKRIECYRKAVALYRGDLLPKLSTEFWVVPLQTHYHSLYLSSVKAYAGLLEQAGLYSEMAQICTQAVSIDNLDEGLHCQLIRALLCQGEDLAALGQYETATNLLYRNLGVKPSEELRSLYLEIMKTRKALETDLGVIQDQLREAEAKPGAFICEYGFFKEAYRLEARRAQRSGMSVFIGLITVSNLKGEIPPLDQLNATMDQLLGAIINSLRKGDVVSRYSGAQFVIMLPGVTYESGEMVMNRIVNNFYRQNHRRSVTLHYKLQQLDL